METQKIPSNVDTHESLQTALWFLTIVLTVLGIITSPDLHKVPFRSDTIRADKKHFSNIIKKIFLGNRIKLLRTLDIKQLILLKCVNIWKYS